MKEPVHVTVQTATMVLPVEVSALHEVQQVMHFVCSRCDLVVGGPAITPPVHFTSSLIRGKYIFQWEIRIFLVLNGHGQLGRCFCFVRKEYLIFLIQEKL